MVLHHSYVPNYELASQAELLADAASIGPEVSVLRAPSIERGYEFILSSWQLYARRFGKPNLAPTLNWIKAFFKTLAKEHRGLIGPLLSLKTLKTYAVRMGCVSREEYGVGLSKGEMKDLQAWIKTHLKQLLGLSSKMRKKPVMATQDLDDILYYLWVDDQHKYNDESNRIKIALYLMFIAYTAARPGAVVVSDRYRNSGEALKYKDLKFCLSKDDEGGPPQMSLTITFELMKGDREKEDEFIKLTLWEDRLYPHLCPIILFLTIAFEHNAFDVKPEELFVATLDRDVVEVKFRAAVLDTPLFRSKDRISAWSYGACHAQVVSLGYRAGYRSRITSYAVRRGAANILDKSATWSETGLILGHKNPKTLQSSYADRHIDIELQGLFHNRVQRTNRMQNLRSLATDRFPGAPSSIRGTDQHQELRQHPDYLAACAEWETLKKDKAGNFLIEKARSKKKMIIEKLRRNATQIARAKWIDNNASIQDRTTIVAIVPFAPWRAKVIELLISETQDQSQKRRQELFYCLRVMFMVRDGTYFCTYNDCARHEKPFKTEAALSRHCDKDHKPGGYLCPHEDCLGRGDSFKTEAALTRHCDKDHKPGGYLCPHEDCQRHENPFPTQKDLTQHCNRSHKQDGLKHFCPHGGCTRSTREFLSRRDLKRHCDRVHGTSKQICPDQHCIRHRKPFSNETSLARHLQEIHGVAHSSKLQTDMQIITSHTLVLPP